MKLFADRYFSARSLLICLIFSLSDADNVVNLIIDSVIELTSNGLNSMPLPSIYLPLSHTLLHNTGNPQDIASAKVFGHPSNKEGRQNTQYFGAQ